MEGTRVDKLILIAREYNCGADCKHCPVWHRIADICYSDVAAVIAQEILLEETPEELVGICL